MKVLCLVGRSGVGKTTLLEQAVRALRERGVAVLALKSSHHAWTDRAGSDSRRFTEAGASGVGFLGSNGAQLALDPPPRLEEVLEWLAPRYEIALVEGGKSAPFRKVELLHDQEPLLNEGEVVARLWRAQPDLLQQFLAHLEP